MCVPGLGPGGEWPAAAKRLAKLAWAVAYRVRKAAGAVEASMALADDDVMLLCQGLEVLEALAECSSDFFDGHKKSERNGKQWPWMRAFLARVRACLLQDAIGSTASSRSRSLSPFTYAIHPANH